MAPKQVSFPRGMNNGKQPRWARPRQGQDTAQIISKPDARQLHRVKKRPPTSAANDKSRLLQLEPGIVLLIAKARLQNLYNDVRKPIRLIVGQTHLPNFMRSCQALWTIGVEVLYKRAVRLRLGSEFPTSSLMEFTPAFKHIERFTRDLTVDITASPTAQAYFQSLAPHLKYSSLTSLVFTLPDLIDGQDHTPSLSALNGASWLLLEDALCNGVGVGALRTSLRNVDLPELCHPYYEDRDHLVGHHHVLDSRIILRFTSTQLQPGEPFQFAAAGRKRTLYRMASGTSAIVARRLLRQIGVGTRIDYCLIRGTAIDNHDGLYRDPFSALGIQGRPSLTKLVFHDVAFRRFPQSIATSIDLSSVRSLHLIQCITHVDLFKLFMLSKSGINIEELCIQILDWDDEVLWEDDPHGFANFILSFSSLQSVSLKSCNRWNRTNAEYPGLVNIWSAHPGLRIYDADFGNDNDLDFEEMDALASQCPKLEVYGSRNIVLAAPIQDGEWSDAFDAEAPYIAETLATGFPALHTWKVYYEPVPIGEPLFDGYEPGDDVHRIVASRLFDYFREACEEHGIKCQLNTIILVAQDVIIPDKTFLRYGMPKGLAYSF